VNIVTPSFRLELTPITGGATAATSPGPGSDVGAEPAEDPPDPLDAAAGAVVAIALGTAATEGRVDADTARVTGGWVRVRVRSGICGFRADFEARTQRESLRRFERGLAAMQDAEGRVGRAELACDEPGIDLRVEARAGGAIAGHFALESERRGGAWTTLSGTFELEPRDLDGIRQSILALLQALPA
jgi:hypothetical protein